MKSEIEEKLSLLELMRDFEKEEIEWQASRPNMPDETMCDSCHMVYPDTEEYWYPSTLKSILNRVTVMYRCKVCNNYRAALGNKDRRNRCVKWADRVAIRAFYRNCPVGYEVDHIIPLQGETVSGLHVLSNLQYLPIKENRKKSNKY